MNLQYISDKKGRVKAVQVQIPIKDWVKAKGVFEIQKDDYQDDKAKLVKTIKKALGEVEMIESGKLASKSLDQLINEL